MTGRRGWLLAICVRALPIYKHCTSSKSIVPRTALRPTQTVCVNWQA